jgi:hypothetical protein
MLIASFDISTVLKLQIKPSDRLQGKIMGASSSLPPHIAHCLVIFLSLLASFYLLLINCWLLLLVLTRKLQYSNLKSPLTCQEFHSTE